MTTIRVEASVRDRLAALAEAYGRSLGAELAAILDDLEWEAIEAGYRRLAANPDDLVRPTLPKLKPSAASTSRTSPTPLPRSTPNTTAASPEHGRHPARVACWGPASHRRGRSVAGPAVKLPFGPLRASGLTAGPPALYIRRYERKGKSGATQPR
jgi:hypothetical protein